MAKRKKQEAAPVEQATTDGVKSLGQVGYEGYYSASDGKSLVSGQDLPSWDLLSAEIQAAWETAASAVAVAVASAASIIGSSGGHYARQQAQQAQQAEGSEE